MTELYLNNQLVDLYPDTVIGLTFTLGDIGEITSRNASYSNQIRLPKSNTNIRVFTHANFSKSSGTGPYGKFSARLLINGIEIKSIGYAILNNVSDSFNISLYSNELDILSALENTYCSDLDYGISDTLDATFFQTYALGDMDVVTPVIDYGRLTTPPVNIDHFTSTSKWKSVKPILLQDCLCASTANRSLSGLAAVDGITPVAGDRVLLKDQTTVSENGIYIASSGTWQRASDCIDVSKLQGAITRVRFGSTHADKLFVQVSITSYSYFSWLGFPLSPSGNWFKQSFWSLNGSANSGLSSNRLPVSDELQLDWNFPTLPQIAGTESYSFSFDILTTILSGSVNYTFRLSLVDETGNYHTVIDQLVNATGSTTVSGSILADIRFTRMVIQLILNVDYGGIDYPEVSISSKGYTVKVTPYTKNMEAEFALPTVKYYKAIELILDSLGNYTLEYPSGTGIESNLKSLLITYSREYYGLRDSTSPIDDTTTVNISKFVLPDISQKELLVDWLFRTQSLIRVSNDLIEVKPIKNIINDRAGAVDWTNKRVSEDSISFASNKFQENYFEDVDLSTQDTNILIANGVLETQYDNVTYQSHEYSFAIADTTLKPEGTIYKSPFASTQRNKNNPHESSSTYQPWCPVWDWSSVDRHDFKHKPELRLLNVNSLFIDNCYYDGAIQYDVKVGFYLYVSSSVGTTWRSMIENHYKPFVNSIQQYKMVSRNYRLSETDIANLDLFKLVYDDGEYFIINKISNYIADKVTRVELLKVT